jgi:cytochrome c556
MYGRIALAAALVSIGVTAATAQSAAIQARKDILKTFGPASQAPGLMLRNERPFDLAAVQASLRVFAEGSPKLPALFPADSQTGDTRALPAIWQEKDKFNAIFAKLEADAKAAMTAITNEATFRTEMPKVLANCGACHNTFRTRQ